MAVSILEVAGEAAVVGIVLLAIAMLIHGAHMRYDQDMSMRHSGMAAQVFLSGFLFHVAAEYTGVNKWYCGYFEGSRA